MLKKRTHQTAILHDSKSRVGELTREIDSLVRAYVVSRDQNVLARASKLSREREDLLKPVIIRSGKIRKAG